MKAPAWQRAKNFAPCQADAFMKFHPRHPGKIISQSPGGEIVRKTQPVKINDNSIKKLSIKICSYRYIIISPKI
jgi:hypothetical protein